MFEPPPSRGSAETYMEWFIGSYWGFVALAAVCVLLFAAAITVLVS